MEEEAGKVINAEINEWESKHMGGWQEGGRECNGYLASLTSHSCCLLYRNLLLMTCRREQRRRGTEPAGELYQNYAIKNMIDNDEPEETAGR